MRATAHIARLLKASPEWRRFFKDCCETGALRLRSQAWQFRAELRDRGLAEPEISLQDVEDSLLEIARKVLPSSLAAQWDTEWAAELCADALARLGEHYAGLTSVQREALDLTAEGDWLERMHQASVANDPAAFRVALKGWERAAGEAFEAAQRSSRSGAA